MDRKFRIETQPYTRAGFIVSNCAAIEFYTDAGSPIAFINERPVPVGTAWAPPTEKNEMDESKYTLRFDGGGDGLCFVSRKIYQ